MAPALAMKIRQSKKDFHGRLAADELLDRSAGPDDLLARRTHARRAVVLVGPRQGEVHARARFSSGRPPNYFDLEDPAGRSALASRWKRSAPLQGLVVIDEVQHATGSVSRPAGADRPRQSVRPVPCSWAAPAPPCCGRRANPWLGRVEVIEIAPSIWRRSVCRASTVAARRVSAGVHSRFRRRRRSLVRNAVDRFVYSDLPQFGINVAAPAMGRFWAMLAHCTARSGTRRTLPVRWGSANRPCDVTWTG